MKLTESMLRSIIREQLKSILNEAGGRIGMGGGFGGNVGMVTKPTAPAKAAPPPPPWDENQKERLIGNIGSDRGLADLDRWGKNSGMDVALTGEQIDWLLKHLGTSLEEVREASRQRKNAEFKKSWEERTKNWPPMGPSPTLGIK